MSQLVAPPTEVEILEALIQPQRPGLDPEFARSVLDMRFSEQQSERVQALAERNNRGELTKDERAEMDSYARVGSFLGLLQSKARLSLGGTRAEP